VLGLTGRGKAESLLGTFVCLLLGHDLALNAGDERVRIQRVAEPRIIRKLCGGGRGFLPDVPRSSEFA